MKKEIQEEVESIAPFFEKISKWEDKRGAMPAGYFEHFQSRVMHQIKELDALQPKEKQSSMPTKTFWSKVIEFFSPKMVLAFSIVLMMGISFYYFNMERTAVFAYEADEVQNYIASNDVNIEDEWIENTTDVQSENQRAYDEVAVDEYLNDNLEEQL